MGTLAMATSCNNKATNSVSKSDSTKLEQGDSVTVDSTAAVAIDSVETE